MTYVIAEPCIDVKDACVDVCPVDCIYEGDDQFYINPDECIDCGACEPECPVEAIFPDDRRPAEMDELHRAEPCAADGGGGVSTVIDAPSARNLTWHAGHVTRAHRERARGHRLSSGSPGSPARERARWRARWKKSSSAAGWRRTCWTATTCAQRPEPRPGLLAPPTARRTSAAWARWRGSWPTWASWPSPPSSLPPAPTATACAAPMGEGEFLEVFVDADLATCEARAPQGPVREGAPRRDPRVHRHLRTLRAARRPRAGR